jgi:hypothetical protein
MDGDRFFSGSFIYATVTFGDGVFVTVNSDTSCRISANGIDWIPGEIEYGRDLDLYGVAWGGGKFVAVGQNGKAYYTSTIGTVVARLVFNSGGSVGWARE